MAATAAGGVSASWPRSGTPFNRKPMLRTRRLRAARGARLWTSVLVAAVAASFAGCGHTAVVGRTRTLQLALTEYRLLPQSISAQPGLLTILVHNYGRLTHNLVISIHGQTVDSTKPLAPGRSAELAMNLAPGSYLMASTLLSDQALGLYGTLTVAP